MARKGSHLRVLVCPTAFKESLPVAQVAEALAAGVRSVRPDSLIRRIPLSDGGPGLLSALAGADGGSVCLHEVSGPLGEPVSARILWTSPGEAVIESADACGLHRVPTDRRDALRGDTKGVGELVLRCLDLGATHVAMGLGGSATVDGGTGLGRVFGYRFLGREAEDLPPGGGSLGALARIEPGSALPEGVSCTAVADVRAVLTGPDGAARRFAPQKGADAEQVEILESGLLRLGERLSRDLGIDVADRPGAGAAGGLGAGCAAFLGAELVHGSDWVLKRVGFAEALAETDLLVTGEGAWDSTSGLGKITWEVLARARDAGVPAVLVCGRASGPVPPGVTLASGDGAWLEAEDLVRLVAGALD